MPSLKKRERLEAAIAGEAVDRVPVALWRHYPGDDQDAESLADAHLRWQMDYDWDFLKISPSSSFCLRDWGVDDKWQGNFEGTRTYSGRVIDEPVDWLKLRILDPDEGMLAVQIEALKLVGRKLDREFTDPAPFLATIFSPLAQAKNLAGGSRLITHLRTHPDMVHKGLETITASIIRYIEAAKTTGIAGIFYAIQHARYALLSTPEYQAFGTPYDEEILAAASDLWLNMIHVHGESDIFFDLVADYPVQIFNWHDRDAGVDIMQGLAMISGAACGGVSRWSLYQDTPEQTIREAEETLAKSQGRRLVLGVGCVAMTNTPLRNIHALRQAVEQ